jgi:predicted nucleic acid-binding protein
MFYFDTSFLIPLLLPEETSDRMEHFFHQLPVGAELVISQWTRVEFASVLSRLVRMGELKKDIAVLCSERFSMLLAENLQVVLPGIADFDLCWKLLARFNNSLRAGDALHLAIAANLAVETIFTLDNGMLKDGRLLGLPVDRGITL